MLPSMPKKKPPSAKKQRWYNRIVILTIGFTVFWWQQHELTIFRRTGGDFSYVKVVDPSNAVNLLQTQGDNWKVWTVDQPILFEHEGFQPCEWAPYRAQYGASEESTPAEMNVCLHNNGDIISRMIRKSGHWNDCLGVSRQYHATNATSSHVHVEIGANIGSCIFELLLSDPEVQILAFEPHPINLFRLTSSLKKNPTLANRVKVFPIALGTAKATSTLVLEDQVNYGSSFLTDKSKSDPSILANTVKPVTIAVEQFDDLVSGEVRLVKIDAQGFECNILDGMKSALRQTLCLTTEVEREALKRMSCSPQSLLGRLQSMFDVYRYRASGKLQAIPVDPMDYNVVAIRRQAIATS